MSNFNEHYFDQVDSEAKAYWLGFIFADGCVLWNERTGNYALQVGLQGRDIDHLVILEKDLGGSRSPDTDPRNGTVRLVWYSKTLAKQLINLGIEPRKSGTERLPSFSPPLARHFWRGVFDGDGCLTTQLKSPTLAPEFRFSLAGSRPVLEAFQQWAQSEVQIRPQKIVVARNSQGDTRTCVFFMNGNRQIAALATVLYQESARWLARKYALYLALLEQNARTRPSYERIY